jgi:hypothetical protein
VGWVWKQWPCFLEDTELRLRARWAWIGISALPPTCCASLNRLLTLSESVSSSAKQKGGQDTK